MNRELLDTDKSKNKDWNKRQKTLNAQGLLATVFQHECDHLDGTLFIDRVEDKNKISFDDEFDLYHQTP